MNLKERGITGWRFTNNTSNNNHFYNIN